MLIWIVEPEDATSPWFQPEWVDQWISVGQPPVIALDVVRLEVQREVVAPPVAGGLPRPRGVDREQELGTVMQREPIVEKSEVLIVLDWFAAE